jgi:omega-6 fatty acid desaturase (delta-12 desaturase)
MEAPMRGKPEWMHELKRFEKVSARRAIGQLLSSALPYIFLFAAMVWVVMRGWPYWVVLILCVPASGFLVRIFILLHDAGHYAFSDSRRVNAILGYACGILTFTSFPDFRRSHAVHHATVGNLDRRGEGDVWTMTTAEYRASTLPGRVLYRFVRNPIVLFLVLAPLNFLALNRIPHQWKRRYDVIGTLLTDAAIPEVQGLRSIGLREGFHSLSLRLYDEGTGTLVDFRTYRKNNLGERSGSSPRP